ASVSKTEGCRFDSYCPCHIRFTAATVVALVAGNMSNSNVETVSSNADRLKLALAVLVLVAGIVGYSMLEGQPAVLRVGVLLASGIAAGCIACSSGPGRSALSSGRDSYNDIKRGAWPIRQETLRMTGIVFAFVIVVGAFLWLVDKILQWVIFGVLLGWN